ncbi:MAG: nickel pincer cofactor biosynthesis protein LarC [Nitrospiraceae bacterium]
MAIHLHFDCFSGISGDMILGALVDAGTSFKDLTSGLKALGLGAFRLTRRKVLRGGLQATKVDVVIEKGFEAPLSLDRIHRILRRSRLPKIVKDRSHAVFDMLAEAEGRAHHRHPSKVHFHEVGVIDSFVDVVGGLLGLHLLCVTRITASPINLGAGTVGSSHGRLPVPAPAVAALTEGTPVYSDGPRRELTTPTGIALLRTVVDQFGALPLMRPTGIGYGAGSADPPGWPNVLRVFLGRSLSDVAAQTDSIVQIETNLDDLNPQAYETVLDRILAVGAVDVTLTPVIMKRGRPGIVLTALAAREKADPVIDIVLRETTALGVRIQEVTRRVLSRRFITVPTSGGDVQVKIADIEPGQSKAAPEYLDCKRIAEQTGRPVRDVMEEAMLAFRRSEGGKGRATRGKNSRTSR